MTKNGSVCTQCGHSVETAAGQTAIGVDVDCSTQYFYWTDVSGKAISRARLDGTDSDAIIQSKKNTLTYELAFTL